VNSLLQFQKRSQLFIRTHNETLSVALKFLLASRRTFRYTNSDDSAVIG
jgi:hypothetical protein